MAEVSGTETTTRTGATKTIRDGGKRSKMAVTAGIFRTIADETTRKRNGGTTGGTPERGNEGGIPGG
jgi:hypothetical protein